LAKGQRTEGIEVSLNGQLTSDWNVMGGYAYQTGEFTSDLPGIASKGTSVGELPRHTFQFGIGMTLPLGWVLHLV